jgi:hypothetical protein
MSLAIRRTLLAGLLTTVLGCTVTIAAPPAPAHAKVGLHATDAQLANEFPRLLKAKDMRGLAKFLDPAFLLQRANGTYLTKASTCATPPSSTTTRSPTCSALGTATCASCATRSSPT